MNRLEKIIKDEKKTSKKEFNLISKYFIFLILIGIPANILVNNSYQDDWTIGEWLINYSGGFVRRGLPGEIIYNISKIIHLSPVIIIWFICIVSYLLMSIIFFKLCKDKISLKFALSPILFLSPLIGNFFIRKDIFGIVLFGISLLIIKNKSIILEEIKFFLINFISIIGILSHESFIFFAIPGLIFSRTVFCNYKKILQFKFRFLLNNIYFFSPSIFISLITIYNKGDINNVEKIHQSWLELSKLISNQDFLINAELPGGAIGQLGWTTSKGIDVSLQLLNKFSGPIWIPGAIILTIFILANLFIGDKKYKSQNLKRFIILYQLFFISPLFVLGRDYGRWMFLWISSASLIFGFILSFDNLNYLDNFFKKFKYPKLIKKSLKGINKFGEKDFLFLIFGIPMFSWSWLYYLASTPLLAPFTFMRMFIDLSPEKAWGYFINFF